MAIFSAEEFVDGVVSYLSTMLPAALDGVHATYAAADVAAGRTVPYSPPRPGASPDGDYYPGGAAEILRYPSVEVALPDETGRNFDIAQIDADIAATLVLMVWDSHAQFPILYRRLLRLTAAVEDLVLSRGALPGSAIVSSLRVAWRFNPEANVRDEVVSGALLALTLGTTRVAP